MASRGPKKQPISLLQFKNKKHLTKEEIKSRKEQEIKAPTGKGEPPSYLTAAQKRQFEELVGPLIELDIYSDIDADCLAFYCIAASEFVKLTKILRKIKIDPEDEAVMVAYKRVATERDRAFRQAERCASDLGLNITSRCRLVVPKIEEKPENKFDKFVV